MCFDHLCSEGGGRRTLGTPAPTQYQPPHYVSCTILQRGRRPGGRSPLRLEFAEPLPSDSSVFKRAEEALGQCQVVAEARNFDRFQGRLDQSATWGSSSAGVRREQLALPSVLSSQTLRVMVRSSLAEFKSANDGTGCSLRTCAEKPPQVAGLASLKNDFPSRRQQQRERKGQGVPFEASQPKRTGHLASFMSFHVY